MLEPDKNLTDIFEKAVELAVNRKHEYLTLEHFLYSLLDDDKFSEVLKNYGAEISTLKKEVKQFIDNELGDIVNPDLEDSLKKLIQWNECLIEHLHKCCLVVVAKLNRLIVSLVCLAKRKVMHSTS